MNRIDHNDPAADRSKAGRIPGITEESAPPTRVLFEERTVRFVSQNTNLDGILTLPRAGQPIPYRAVLFLPGSGPVDRDGRVGPNRPFLELARGLAVHGIASFRFDKRTVAAPQSFDPVKGTVQEELIDDAIAALEALRSQGEIDGKLVVIAGHDIGGALAPGIAEVSPAVAGIVMLAGSPRPLDLILRDQIETLMDGARERDTLFPEQESSYLRTLAMLDSLEAGTLPDRRSIRGTSRRYLDDYRKRDLAAELLSYGGPVLFLQGGNDHRITLNDFDGWKRIVEEGKKTNVDFRTFPTLGHLFIPVEGEVGSEIPIGSGSVDPGVIGAIADFVKSLP